MKNLSVFAKNKIIHWMFHLNLIQSVLQRIRSVIWDSCNNTVLQDYFQTDSHYYPIISMNQISNL